MSKKSFTIKEAERVAQAIGIDWQKVNFNLEQFRQGMNVELEHGTIDPKTNVTNDDAIMTGKIALAHLKEFGDYYDRLKEMEKEEDDIQ